MTIAYTPDLMTQATQSTRNIGWLQEYLSLWNLLNKTCKRLIEEQEKQPRKDEKIYAELLHLRAIAAGKVDQLDDAYSRAYAKHLMLMDRVLNEEPGS